MNNQMPYPYMPNWQGGQNFPNPIPGPGMGPIQHPSGGCQCRDQLNQLENRITRLERQVRRLDHRVSRLEGGFPVPLMSNGNDQDYNSSAYSSNGMYMM